MATSYKLQLIMATLFFYTKKATKKSLLKVLFLFIKIH